MDQRESASTSESQNSPHKVQGHKKCPKLFFYHYVTTPNAYLFKDGQNIVISVENEEIFRIPAINIQAINTFGYQGASPGIMKLCSENGISLSFHMPNGRFIGRLQGPTHGNILLRSKQFEYVKDKKHSLSLAILFVYGKLYNSRAILQRFLRDNPDNERKSEISEVIEKLKRLAIKSLQSSDHEHLRGLEGEGASHYFSVFDNMVLHQKKDFKFDTRNRRPPTDFINAMLSMGYSMLANDCSAALEGVGLDPAAGLMHSLRPGRNSLALDLMEEMRGYIVDRFVLSMINTRQITASDFKSHTDTTSDLKPSVTFTDSGLKKFLGAWQTRKKTEFCHPYLNEKVSVGLLPHVQALLLARCLRGDIDSYPVFLIK